MNHSAENKTMAGTHLSISDWQKESTAGREVWFLCVYYDHFGFGMSMAQVEEAADKLEALLLHGETPQPGGEIQVDRSGTEDGWVMIAFRPAVNHQSRYFDFPEETARELLVRLRDSLKATVLRSDGCSAQGQ
jgi:hypothetical protein